MQSFPFTAESNIRHTAGIGFSVGQTNANKQKSAGGLPVPTGTVCAGSAKLRPGTKKSERVFSKTSYRHAISCISPLICN